MNRRRFLQSFIGGSGMTIGGCATNTNGQAGPQTTNPPTTTEAPSTSGEKTTERCTSTESTKSSAVLVPDLQVSNSTSSSHEMTVSISKQVDNGTKSAFEQSYQLGPEEDVISDAKIFTEKGTYAIQAKLNAGKTTTREIIVDEDSWRRYTGVEVKIEPDTFEIVVIHGDPTPTPPSTC